MEPLSVAASLLSTLEATAFVSKATTELYRSLRDAPKELAQLSTRISQTRSRLDVQLHLYQSFSGGNTVALLPEEALKTLHADLIDAKNCLEAIWGLIPANGGHTNGKQRISWVMRDKRKVMKIVHKLQDIDNNLTAMHGTLSL
ncbi:MAG: hypothetical protein LQ338_007801, partial [Usnochroma carphineum]